MEEFLNILYKFMFGNPDGVTIMAIGPLAVAGISAGISGNLRGKVSKT